MTAREPQVVAVGGGKGGVGKSLIAANLGIFLATLGKKVVVVDCSLGAPNLHLFCGVPRPTRTLAEALVPGGAPLADLAVSTPVPGMRLIAGAADPAWVADVDLATAQALLAEVRELPCDWVVLDLAGGMSAVVLELFLGADVGIVAAVPDPTSVELMHRFIGAAFLHRLRQHGLSDLAERHAAPKGGIAGPLEIYLDAVEADDPYLEHLRAAILGFAPQLVINAARSKHDMELGRAITSATHRRLGVPIGYLGHLEYDEAVWASTRLGSGARAGPRGFEQPPMERATANARAQTKREPSAPGMRNLLLSMGDVLRGLHASGKNSAAAAGHQGGGGRMWPLHEKTNHRDTETQRNKEKGRKKDS